MTTLRRQVSAPPRQWQIAGRTHIGKVRSTNEDRLLIEPELGLCAVLDGMGGRRGGDVAAELAANTVRAFVQQHAGQLAPRALVEKAVKAASAAVYSYADERIECQGMGTTIVACLLVEPAHVVIGYVGDSRAYLLRSGRLLQLTRDHTVAEEWITAGWLRPEDAEQHPTKNTLSLYVGKRDLEAPDVVELALAPGERLLLCSDGLSGMASADALQRVLGSNHSADQIAHALIQLALRGGGGDNVSAIVIADDQLPSDIR